VAENFVIKAYIARNSTAIAKIYKHENGIFRHKMRGYELIRAFYSTLATILKA
jgi:hypothetical protein